MSKRKPALKTDRKLHRHAERRNKKTVVVVIVAILLISGTLLLPRLLPSDPPAEEKPADAEPAKSESVAPRLRRARVVWLDGKASMLGSDRKVEDKDWLWDQEGVEVAAESAITLRSENGLVFDLPPASAMSFPSENQQVCFMRGGITLDSREQKGDADLHVRLGKSDGMLKLKKGSMAILLQSRPYTLPAATEDKFSLAIHVWQGGLELPKGRTLQAGNSRLFVFAGAEADFDKCEFDLALTWKEAGKARQGKFTLFEGETSREFDHASRHDLSQRGRLLSDDLARQVECISQGTRLDVDLITLLREKGVLENGLRLLGGRPGDPSSVVSFIDASGRELVKGVLGSVLAQLDESMKPRARRILAQRILPQKDQVLDAAHIKIDISERGLTQVIGSWVQVPEGFEDQAVIVRKEALANKKLLLTFIAEMISCTLTETEWGYELVRK